MFYSQKRIKIKNSKTGNHRECSSDKKVELLNVNLLNVNNTNKVVLTI